MTTLAKIEDIESAVRQTLTADFDNVRILSVKVLKDVDFEGDDVLRIDVVFEGSRKDLDAKKISGAVRQVRPRLRELGEKAFPLFSFISKNELNAGRLAPA